LADAFISMRLPFESETAKRLEEYIFEIIDFAACEASCVLAAKLGAYGTYAGSRMQLVAHHGIVQRLDVPGDLKELYKSVGEVKQRTVRNMAADRGAHIYQSQSLSVHMVGATTAKLSSMHSHGWQSELKTGLFYLRTKAAVGATKFTCARRQQRPFVS
jgi:ribonucleotide reductase alpha subunit